MRSVTMTQKGFSFPELLVSVGILAFSLSILLSFFIGSVSLNENARNLSIATSHATFVLEDIRNSSFPTLSANISAGNWNWNAATIASRGLTALKAEVITTSVSGTDLLTVTTRVNWQDAIGRIRTMSLVTLTGGS